MVLRNVLRRSVVCWEKDLMLDVGRANRRKGFAVYLSKIVMQPKVTELDTHVPRLIPAIRAEIETM
jgi:hypothetical protein